MENKSATRLSFGICILFSTATQAGDFTRLKGDWNCQEEGSHYSLIFTSADQLIYNGEVNRYQLDTPVIRVQGEFGPVDYRYEFQQRTLLILSPDGSISYCHKANKNPPDQQRNTAKPSVPASGNWPPPYRRPGGNVDWDSTDPGSLLYKFAGRWDSATSNTLHNLYLKPDGTYEEAYEAGYSGQFHDQGGYQTGNWGEAGQQRWQGSWKAIGSLQSGTLTLIDHQGNRTDYQYQVHIERGEYYGGEYFFNGKLYSVNYIYR